MDKETLKDYLRHVVDILDILRGLIALPFLFALGLLTIPVIILSTVIDFLIGDLEDVYE